MNLLLWRSSPVTNTAKELISRRQSTMKITKKHIFEQKLSGKPIYVHVNEISDEEIQLLIDCGIVEQFAPNAPRRVADLSRVIALYPIVNCMPYYPVVVGVNGDHIYKHMSLGPLDYVKLRDNSLIYKET